MTDNEKIIVGKAEFVKDLSEALSVPKKRGAEVLDAVLGLIEGYLKEGKSVRMIPFGSFQVVYRGERKGQRPGHKGEEITIPARNVPTFKPGKALKDAVNEE